MPKRDGRARPPARTVLEQLIRERLQTFEEFAEYADIYAREHDELGTLSVRHLQRLVAGRQSDGTALGPLRPATARLLERIFDMGIVELLASPKASANVASVIYPLRVAIAVVVNGSDVLIVRRRAGSGQLLSWQFPAGVVKPEMEPETVAVQETLGETNVHCVVRYRLGTRVHPMTNVLCDYLLCEYLAGIAENADVDENAGVSWIPKAKLTRFIPVDQIYPPVLEALEV